MLSPTRSKLYDHPIIYVEAALNDANRGRYYSQRTGEVIEKAEAALDGFMGAVVNIENDNGERNVARQGEQLSSQLRRGERYLERADRNQDAMASSMSSAVFSIHDALDTGLSGSTRRDLLTAQSILEQLSKDQQVEQSVGHTRARMNDSEERLVEVTSDAPGKDVSEHGRPLSENFHTSITQLHAADAAEQNDRAQADKAIAILEDVYRRLEP